MSVVYRPLSTYPVPETVERVRAKFGRASYSVNEGTYDQPRTRYVPKRGYSMFEVCGQLEAELVRAGVLDAVLELDMAPGDFRLDGLPRSDRRVKSPRVVVSFAHPEQGPLRFPCDTYDRVEDNVRAIVLALNALRAIDRYGVVRRAEQYAGWTALPAQTSAGLNVKAALALIVATDPVSKDLDSKASEQVVERYLRDRVSAREAFRNALVACHPDRTGESHDTFATINSARATLAAHFGGTW